METEPGEGVWTEGGKKKRMRGQMVGKGYLFVSESTGSPMPNSALNITGGVRADVWKRRIVHIIKQKQTHNDMMNSSTHKELRVMHKHTHTGKPLTYWSPVGTSKM